MDDIINLFKKSDDYDENLSFDKIIKNWEENYLASGQHNNEFSYPIEYDNFFDNASSTCDVKNNKQILLALFDRKLTNYDTKNKFTCINETCMYNCSNSVNDKLTEKNIWKIKRNCDTLSKPFFRLILKKNISEKEISNLLYLLSDCTFSIIIGGKIVLEIPKLLFIFLICKKISHSINIFDVNEYLKSNTMDEIKKKISKITNNGCHINQKYYVRNNTDFYLDIPLLVDFFMYGMSTQVLCIQYHNIEFELKIPKNKVKIISSYIEGIVLMFEDIYYADTIHRKQLAQKSFEFIKMTSSIDYYHCWNDSYIELNGHEREKFIFIIIRQHEFSDYESGIINQINDDVNVTQFPQISQIELLNDENKQYNISLEKIWVGQFDNMIIYGIAADGVSDMSNWIKVLSEGVESIENLNLYLNAKINNLNQNNYDGLYLISNLDKIKISWYNSNIPVNIEIVHLKQNIQQIMGGMSGDTYL